MLRLFRKKQKNISPYILELPENAVEQFYVLKDEYGLLKAGTDFHAKYLMWKYIEDIFPEVKTGEWRLDTRHATKVKIIRGAPDNEANKTKEPVSG
ncbi:MAG: hypothetical protein PHE17_18205 [Thiothrix sp.]|uniref:hypothetical protein n=1 Tax=Thiothrix sp. TaxID=1032 RepID=UPI0026362D52|nr:hypothetical protein [Thiothrix sp.]MDD5394955.1 hypothetical protein [Thiothrix sp.]